HNESQILIRYTLLEANSPTILRLKPFLAYRSIHKLSKANMLVNTKYTKIESGIRSKLYNGFPSLNMQISKPNEFVAVPDWYYNIEYTEEKARGYDFREDQFVPGYFEFPIEAGESIVFSASTVAADVKNLETKFQELIGLRCPRNHCENCLRYSASQFIVKNGDETKVIAGYPWFGSWGRDTFIALPGVTLAANNDTESCKNVLDSMTRKMKNGLFPNIGSAYNSVDAPMWFFKALQEYGTFIDSHKTVWENYGAKMKSILKSFKKGVNKFIFVRDNGLIWADEPGKALTWMDALVDGVPVTPRGGFQVEVNALWYNAICYTLELAREFEDTAFIHEWEPVAEKIRKSFIDIFWNDTLKYLADSVNQDGQNTEIRPNQIIACSLEYSVLTDEMKSDVIAVIRKNLLTPKGLRTLAPIDKNYHGTYEGNQRDRDLAYHQGTVWPWLIG
ncbi:MAG: amylo-alpha-1,6-glucosidase, partial [Rikenellaceae bacterium]